MVWLLFWRIGEASNPGLANFDNSDDDRPCAESGSDEFFDGVEDSNDDWDVSEYVDSMRQIPGSSVDVARLEPFVKAKAFVGYRRHYVFKLGCHGVGYYIDTCKTSLGEAAADNRLTRPSEGVPPADAVFDSARPREASSSLCGLHSG